MLKDKIARRRRVEYFLLAFHHQESMFSKCSKEYGVKFMWDEVVQDCHFQHDLF